MTKRSPPALSEILRPQQLDDLALPQPISNVSGEWSRKALS
jgi:hypothetical protein